MNGTSTFPGHCFLHWFAGDALVAARQLPAIATVADLRRIANSYPNPFSSGTFGLITEMIDGRNVWHIVAGPWSPALCLANLGNDALVGAAAEVKVFPGHCYLQWFAGSALLAARELPPIATVADLRRIANSYANPFSAGTFGVLPKVFQGQAVWHVVSGPWTPATCLANLDRSALVGAVGDSAGTAQDISRQVHEVAETVTYPATEIRSSTAVMKRKFYFSFTLGGGAGEPVSFNLFPNAIGRVVAVSRLFESVRLVAASAEIVVEASTTARVGVGLSKVNTHAKDIGTVRGMSHNMVAYGKVDAPKVSVWDLPDRITFSREYKMVAVGNAPAYICFHFAGGSADSAEVNGYLELEFAGEGITQPIRLRARDQERIAGHRGDARAVEANIGRARAPLAVGDSSEEDDDDDN